MVRQWLDTMQQGYYSIIGLYTMPINLTEINPNQLVIACYLIVGLVFLKKI